MITGHSDDASKRMNSNQGLERHFSHIKMSAKQMEKKEAKGIFKKINNMKEKFSKEIEI